MEGDKRTEDDVVMDDAQSEEEQTDNQSENAEDDVIVSADKMEIIAGATGDQTAMTFCFKEEDHTLGNSLRHMINKNPQVDFCGYSIPHPSEAKMHMRIQTTKRTNAVDALKKGMDDLTELCEYIKEAYMAELANHDTAMD
ncbi:RBP11-like subunits of RNA polymerase [Lichtheimia hyalospora FSU 10163]|nr:RBP11-like subunits of RNA polymerase [Lichtheimia hyalospora FSU 10163]